MTLGFVGHMPGRAFILADAAVSNPHRNDRVGPTSTGEAQKQSSSGLFVDEDMLKLFRLGDGAGTFAGSLHAFQSVARTLADAIEVGQTYRQALELALANNPQSAADLDLIVAHPSAGEVAVVVHRSSGLEPVHLSEHEAAIIGSAPSHVSDALVGLFEALSSETVPHDSKLVVLLAVLQALAIRMDLIDFGIGGALAGTIVEPSGSHWQPDVLYMQRRGSRWVPHHVMFRDGVQIVGSSFRQMTTLSEDRPKAFREPYRNYHDYARFDFVVLLDPTTMKVSVFEMRKRRASRDLKLEIVGETVEWDARVTSENGWGAEIDGVRARISFSPFVEAAGEPNQQLCLEYDRLMSDLPPEQARLRFDELLRSDASESRYAEEIRKDDES